MVAFFDLPPIVAPLLALLRPRHQCVRQRILGRRQRLGSNAVAYKVTPIQAMIHEELARPTAAKPARRLK